MNNKDILVTGGAGFIGSNLSNYLANSNDVVAVDDCSLGTPSNLLDNVRFVNKSVLDEDLPTDVDIVFHMAALSSYNMHEENPREGSKVNVEGFVNTVDQARKDDCDTVIYASTSSIYGTTTTPVTENADVYSNTAYEASKLSRENYASYFTDHYEMTMCGLRFFSVYQGYGGSESHKGEYANVIAQFAEDIAQGSSPKIYGDGTQSRDFTHVSDVVSAVEKVADAQLSGIYNVGTGERTTFNEIVDLINNAMNTQVDPEYVENPIPDDTYIYHTCADNSKIKRHTDWRPEIDIEEGIEMVCEDYT